MTRHNEATLQQRRNELEAELGNIKEVLKYIEKERREHRVNAVIEMVKNNPNIWDVQLVNKIETISSYEYDEYKVSLWLEYDNLDR